jgi:seryl-tRNA synthetase
MHILQAQLKQIVEWTNLLQSRRAAIVERIVRATANSKIARALQVERALDRTIASMLRDLESTNVKLNKIADKLNKCRGLLLELSDGEVFVEKTERANGLASESETDRGGPA